MKSAPTGWFAVLPLFALLVSCGQSTPKEPIGTGGSPAMPNGNGGTSAGGEGSGAGGSGIGGNAGAGVGGTAGGGPVGGSASMPICGGGGADAGSMAPELFNDDFEAGAANWIAFGPSALTLVTEPARSGNALSVAGRTDTWNGAAQSLLNQVQSGDQLQVSGWVRVDVESAPVTFSLKTTINAVEAYAQVAAATANNTEWTQLTGSLSLDFMGGEPSSIELYLEGPPAGVILYLDDVTASLRGAVGGNGSGNPDGSVNVGANIADTHQTLEGFGASLAWYHDLLLSHAKAAEIYPIIFGDLGLDLVRLRNRHARSTEVVDLNTEVTLIAKATESLGHAPKILLTSWSPPASLKASGVEDCTDDTATCTLTKAGDAYDYEGFADYWSESLDAYAALNIVPDYISIQNEPDFVPNGWEGCKFEPSETETYAGYDQALQAVSDKLTARGAAPIIIGPETLGVHWNRVQNYAAKLNPDLLGGWAHHLYEKGNGPVWLWQDPGPDAFIAPITGALLVQQGKPIFMTEFQTDEDTLTTGGFETGWLIHNSLSEGNTSSWLYWNLVWDKSGLVALDGENYTIRDQYYALRHYAKFTDIGDQRVSVSSNLPQIRATAWQAPDASRLTFVLLNVGDTEKTVHLSACDFAFAQTTAVLTTFKTDGTSQRWQELEAVNTEQGIVLPSRSMATVVFTP